LLIECTTEKYELNWNIFKKIWKNFRKPELKFENWVITDFDDCLLGNPYTSEDPDLRNVKEEEEK
jgi:hypothetical protein